MRGSAPIIGRHNRLSQATKPHTKRVWSPPPPYAMRASPPSGRPAPTSRRQSGAPDVAAEQVAVAVRKQDQVARRELDRRGLVRQAGAAAPLHQQVVDRDVLRARQDLARIVPAGRRVDAPRRGELGIKEDAASSRSALRICEKGSMIRTRGQVRRCLGQPARQSGGARKNGGARVKFRREPKVSIAVVSRGSHGGERDREHADRSATQGRQPLCQVHRSLQAHPLGHRPRRDPRPRVRLLEEVPARRPVEGRRAGLPRRGRAAPAAARSRAAPTPTCSAWSSASSAPRCWS